MTKRQRTIKLNHMNRVQAVQEVYNLHKQEGIPDAFIWRKHIYPKYFISLDTFYRYLQISPKTELKKMGIAQPTLF